MIKVLSYRTPATLALADGTVFRGYAVGREGETSGEVVFNTSLSGYQEILTDPSYSNQMITFTYPHIGNVGCNYEDVESSQVHVSGFIARELSREFSNFRAELSLQEYLEENYVVGIAGIDTRALVIHLRTHGSQMGVISSGEVSSDDLVDKARALTSMEGRDLVKVVACRESYQWTEGVWQLGDGFPAEDVSTRPHLVAIDFGIKRNILRIFIDLGFRVSVVPPTMSASEILALSPVGVFLSNGPGDPAAVTYGIDTVRDLVGKVPMFGICLGHQILGLSLGAETFKLKFGHRGGNHPVRNELSKKVEITVQNHGFAIDAGSMPKGVKLTHLNLNDQTVEGLAIEGENTFSVQYHPESSPGPIDSRYLFKQFAAGLR